jgi:hypothetical protein
VDYWDTLSLSSAQKTALILQEINDLDLLGKFSQGRFIGPGFHQEFRTVLFSLYWWHMLLCWSDGPRVSNYYHLKTRLEKLDDSISGLPIFHVVSLLPYHLLVG